MVTDFIVVGIGLGAATTAAMSSVSLKDTLNRFDPQQTVFLISIVSVINLWIIYIILGGVNEAHSRALISFFVSGLFGAGFGRLLWVTSVVKIGATATA